MKKVHISMINLWCNKNLVDSQLFLWKLLSENPDKIEYYSDPYEKWVEIVILNTCSFISSGREEMFQTVEKLLSKKKKVCIIGCGVQYFEKLLKKNMSSFKKGGGFNEVEDVGFLSIDDKKSPIYPPLPKGGLVSQNDNLNKSFKDGKKCSKMRIFPIFHEMTLI